MPEASIAALRKLTASPKEVDFVNLRCEQSYKDMGRPPQFLSGPSRWLIERNGAKLAIGANSPCLTTKMKELSAVFADAISSALR